MSKADATRAMNELKDFVLSNPELKALVERLESIYDARAALPEDVEESPPLSPEVEKFLMDMDKRFDVN